jgi:hypothetical protein
MIKANILSRVEMGLRLERYRNIPDIRESDTK